MMRIITGKARGVRLATLEGENTRPTSERAKEAIFSMLQFEIDGARVLDLFAGSGQMGLEALSRGAAHAVFCDLSKDAVEIVKTNIKKTRMEGQCDVFCGDYKVTLQGLRNRQNFDLVFLDPPYRMTELDECCAMLADAGLLAPDAMLVLEHRTDAAKLPDGRFELFRERTYADTQIHFYLYAAKEGE